MRHALLIALLLLPTLARAQDAEPLKITSLEQALALAERNNPNLLQSVERLVKTRASVAQILAAKRPQIQSGASYSRLLNVASSFGGGGGGLSPAQLQNPFPAQVQGGTPGSQPVTLSTGGIGGGPVTRSRQTGGTTTTGTGTGDSGTGTGTGFQLKGGLNNYSFTAGITQLIDLTGLLKAAESLGDLETKIQTLEIEKTRLDLIQSVKTGYYGVLRAEAQLTVSDAAVAQSREQLRVTEAQKSAGVVAEFDVLRARTQLLTNEQSLISARNQVAITKNAFANSLGLEPSTPVTLTPPTGAEIPALPDLAETPLLARALTARPEARQLDLSVRKSTANLKLAHRTMDPFATAGISASYNPKPTGFVQEKTTGSLSLALSFPLSDGGATRAAIDSARSDIRSVAIQQDQWLRGIRAEVQQAIIAVKDADERLKSAAQNVVQAREAYRLAGVRFKAGVDTQLSVNDAQTTLTQAESAQVNARYDYLIALARLERAAGPEPEKKKEETK